MPSLNTELRNRTLWFDGDSSYRAADIMKLISKHDIKYVDDVTHPLVRQFNQHVAKQQELQKKTECKPFDVSWNIPDRYLKLDLTEYVINKHIQITKNVDPTEAELRDIRILEELAQFQELGLCNMLKAIIYLIDVLDANNVVRGVGRGSSVASYVLYVLGVHDVDSYLYGLEIAEFLHD